VKLNFGEKIQVRYLFFSLTSITKQEACIASTYFPPAYNQVDTLPLFFDLVKNKQGKQTPNILQQLEY